MEDRRFFMLEAFKEAETSLSKNEVPIGCVIVKDGEIISRGHNLTNQESNATKHAEFVAIDDMHGRGFSEFGDCDLYVTIESCVMCTAMLMSVGVGRVFFGGYNDRFGGCGSVLDVVGDNPDGWKAVPEFVGGIMAEKAIGLIKLFYKSENSKAPPGKRIKK